VGEALTIVTPEGAEYPDRELLIFLHTTKARFRADHETLLAILRDLKLDAEIHGKPLQPAPEK
jgi:hypothetical protein